MISIEIKTNTQVLYSLGLLLQMCNNFHLKKSVPKYINLKNNTYKPTLQFIIIARASGNSKPFLQIHFEKLHCVPTLKFYFSRNLAFA
jgi:hypothetical protein